MKINKTEPAGVQHQKISAERYHLRRYIPNESLTTFIEQFWFVSWDLKGEQSHTQKNLPDPNFHVVIENSRVKLIGPVSKSYTYKMAGAGNIIGIKFSAGSLTGLLQVPVSDYIDTEVDLTGLVPFDVDRIISKLKNIKRDEKIVQLLQRYIRPFVMSPSPELIKVRYLLSLIKTDVSISRVEHLSVKANVSVRTIQRYFSHYLGLNPKWLIRKYRLHHALALMEQREVSFLDMVEWLGYTDQSHLIRDFKDIIGVTPSDYIKQ